MGDVKNKKLILIIFLYLILKVYLMINYIRIYSYIINPIFGTIMIILSTKYIKQNYDMKDTNKRSYIYIFAISIINILIYFSLGYIFNFLKSPYSHKILTIISNIIINIVPIIGIELARTAIIIKNKNNKKIIVLTTIILIFLEINYKYLSSIISNIEGLFRYICSNIIPCISYGILYTYLCQKKPFALSIIYRTLYELAILLFPILPNIDWFIQGTFGLIMSFFVYIMYNMKETKDKKESLKNKIAYFSTIILSLFIICFMLGAFKYKPIAILSNSMYPTFNRGDIVIYKKVPDNELKEIKENNIIVYSVNDEHIVHRIVEKYDNENVLYETKGDNNNTSDQELVEPTQIEGIYVFHIKYIGFPSVFLYELFNSNNI